MSNAITQRQIREFHRNFTIASRVVLGCLAYLALSCGTHEFLAAAATWGVIELTMFSAD